MCPYLNYAKGGTPHNDLVPKPFIAFVMFSISLLHCPPRKPERGTHVRLNCCGCLDILCWLVFFVLSILLNYAKHVGMFAHHSEKYQVARFGHNMIFIEQRRYFLLQYCKAGALHTVIVCLFHSQITPRGCQRRCNSATKSLAMATPSRRRT